MIESHWLYQNKPIEEIPEDAYGFIYKITHNDSGKSYIGKKKFSNIRRVKKKGRKNRKVVTKESDWANYMSSCIPLQNQINEIGKDKFKFEIIIFCYTKGQMNYAEEHTHHLNNVLTAKLSNGDRAFYNECIGNNRWRNIRFTDQFINQL